MDTLFTTQRRWTREDVAQLLTSRTALTELKLEQALYTVQYLTPQRIKAGSVLIREGATNTGFMLLILQGEALVENELANAGDSMVLNVLGSGALVGEQGVLDGQPRSATVTAMTDLDVAILDREALSRLLTARPDVGCSLLAAILARVSERLRVTTQRLRTLTAINRSLHETMDAAPQCVNATPTCQPVR
jgi:CRP-like cAMP-binding protein